MGISIAVLVTVFNRKQKTLNCLESINRTISMASLKPKVCVFLTDDGSTDGTAKSIKERDYLFPIIILQGDGNLYWNGGMINSWNAALGSDENYDGFLWLNNDTIILPGFWDELQEANGYCHQKYGIGGIYVGSTCNNSRTKLSYGGFNYVNKITLKDEFVIPNSQFQECQCAHGNLTYVSNDVVEEMGIFTDEYIHSGGDHDYTYRAYKRGFHLIVLPSFVGVCENDHIKGVHESFLNMTLKERIASLKKPVGFNLHNTLVFQRRCFPYRYPFVWLACWLKILFPNVHKKIFQWLRK